MKKFKYIGWFVALWMVAISMAAQPLVQNASAPYSITQGLQGRHLTLWASHGKYYNEKRDRWEWQRARLFETVEDLYTSSYTMPYLVPMLERAGAVVLQPRERDPQTEELIAERDIRLETDSLGTRQEGISLDVKQAGDYALYIRYPLDKKNIPDAHIRFSHDGVQTDFLVNQTMDHNSWLYLGTYHFQAGSRATVSLSNESRVKGRAVLSQVRLGGGMGSMERGGTVSGYARYQEAAKYYLEYDGVPSSVWHTQTTEYKDDIHARGNWVNWLQTAQHVPVDLSLALHTDAGMRPGNGIIGTLVIYTHPDQRFSRLVQDQLVEDLQKTYAPEWNRRSILNKDYLEAKEPTVPAILIELLSHENLGDMRYGLDPRFRFDASRAIYKGMLRYLAQRKKFSYCIEPLPVKQFSARLKGDSVRLSWSGEEDPLEESARPTYYLLYTARGGDDWDNGRLVEADTTHTTVQNLRVDSVWLDSSTVRLDTSYQDSTIINTLLTASCEMRLDANVQYRFRVVAANTGGLSMPSETLAAYRDSRSQGHVLLINGFTRVAAPQSFDLAGQAGFVPGDPGVPDGYDYFRTGYQYDFDRKAPWVSDDVPGWGASDDDQEHSRICGNTHDQAVQEGRLWEKMHYSYSSTTAAAVAGTADDTLYDALDLILGEQKRSPLGKRVDYDCFPDNIRQELSAYQQRQQRGLLLVSGSHVGDDLNDKAARSWALTTLHYSLLTDHGTRTGLVADAKSKKTLCRFETEANPDVCAAPSTDVLAPASGGRVLLRYGSNQKSAAVSYEHGQMRTLVLGFPILAIKSEKEREQLLKHILEH